MVKLNEGGAYLKTAEAKDGEVVEFLNEGEWIENSRYTYPDGNPRMDFVCQVRHNNEEKKMRVNKTNRDVLVAAWGIETKDWVNKKAKIELETALIAGKRQKMILLHPEGVEVNPVDDSIAWDE